MTLIIDITLQNIRADSDKAMAGGTVRLPLVPVPRIIPLAPAPIGAFSFILGMAVIFLEFSPVSPGPA
jgi:hypothetical protein